MRASLALKMLINAHSTAVMTLLGRVVGNTMTNVRAANLKLIGRATYLSKMHIDDVRRDVSYAQTNNIMFGVMDYLRERGRAEESPVPLTIVAACEEVGVEEAERVLQEAGSLEAYIYSKRKEL